MASLLPFTAENQQINIQAPSSYEFGFEMGLIPTLELPKLEETPFTQYTIKLEEDKINEEIEKFRVRFGTVTESETIGADDALETTFAELDSNGNVKEDGVTNNASISLISIVDKQLVDQILPLKKGDFIDFNINEAFGHNHELIVHTILNVDHHTADTMGTQFRMSINKINHVEKAEVNEDLFNKVFGEGKIKTEEEMREKVRQEILAQYKRTSEQRLFSDISTSLIDKTNIDLPVEFLKKWILTTNKNPITPEQLEKEFDAFVRQMKWDLIVDKIVKENNIEVKPEELKDFVKEEFRSRYFDGQVNEEMENSINRIADMVLDNEKNRKDYINKLLENKIFEELKKKAKIEAKEISYHDYIHA